MVAGSTEPQVIETTKVTVEPAPSRTKLVTIPVDKTVIPMGVHGGVANHFGLEEGTYEPHATTLDYLVGATVACLTGTFGGRLAQLGQSTADGALKVAGEGDIVREGSAIRVAAVRVRYELTLSEGVAEKDVRRAHETHHRFCPVSRSIGDCVDISTELTIAPQ